LCKGLTSIAGFCFSNIASGHFIAINLTGSSIGELWSHPDLQAGMDIIIEDGLHTFEGNVSFLEESLDHLCPGRI
jgi:hypothetical protein